MNVSATFQGSLVNFVDIDVNGSDIYMSYIDASGNLKVSKTFYTPGASSVIIATGSIVN